MATAFPNQQQQPLGETFTNNPNDQQLQSSTSSSNGDSSSGSIGPFFAVISVLTVLAILSCVFGRIYSRRVAAAAPVEIGFKERGCFGWVKRIKCRRPSFMAGHHDVEVGANNKVRALGEERNDTANE